MKEALLCFIQLEAERWYLDFNVFDFLLCKPKLCKLILDLALLEMKCLLPFYPQCIQ